MRQVITPQPLLGQVNIADIKLNLKSRDDIPHVLLGLQHIYTQPELWQAVSNILKQVKPPEARSDRGRIGMEQWKILVLGVLRLGLNTDHDRICELANEHKTIRQFLGHSGWLDEGEKPYQLQTIKDNLRYFTEAHYDQINQLVVKSGHTLVKKSPNDGRIPTANEGELPLYARADSFVVLTNVHFPTDFNLLYDAVRKTVTESRTLADECGLSGWRQSQYLINKFKKQYRIIQQLKRSKPKSQHKQQAHDVALEDIILSYLNQALELLERSQKTAEQAKAKGVLPFRLVPLEQYQHYIQLFQDQIYRRNCLDERIPHKEKVFSIFEPHTEWINKGKAGVPVELGVRVCIVEDQYRFILHHNVMQQQTDDKIAVSIAKETLTRYPTLTGLSYDKGFHSQQNQKELAELIEQPTLPKKGKCNEVERKREQDETFRHYRKKHSAVESAINALEHNGLDICPDHGIDGFKRYVALAVVSRNIKRLGQLIRQQAIEEEERRRGPYRKKA